MDNKELVRLRKIYPLFELKVSDKLSIEGGEILEVIISRGHSFHSWLTKRGRLDHESERMLDLEHCKKYVAEELHKQYPDLHSSPYIGRADLLVSVWADRDGRDAEAIGHIQLFAPNFREQMLQWQEEARIAKKEGWFFCSGHSRAEKREDGYWFHFAGSYCKQYGDENPEARRAAARETYN